MASTHGMSKTRLYGIWNGMMMRCYNPNRPKFKNYGGRGIFVSKRWHKFECFMKDMISGYEDHLTLERVDVNKGYSIKNCCWVESSKQPLNKQNSIRFTVKGELLSPTEAAKKYNIKNIFTLYARIKNGYKDDEIVFGRQWKETLDFNGKRVTFREAAKIANISTTGMRHRAKMKGIDMGKIFLSKNDFNAYIKSIGMKTGYA